MSEIYTLNMPIKDRRKKALTSSKKGMNLVFFMLLLAVQVTDDGHNTLPCLFPLCSSFFSFGG